MLKPYDKYTFFYNGVFSQFLSCRFVIAGTEYNCAEQWMMASKAQMFKDVEMHEKIMASSSPYDQKMKFGRNVKNFDKSTWEKSCRQLVYLGNQAKFGQNKDLLKILLDTKGTLLVEASPTDKIWGIGLGMDNPKKNDRANWQGTNWLGEILTELRDDFIATIEKEREGTSV